jgi:hypothetical protein
LVAPTLENAIEQLTSRDDVGDIYICGGTRLYTEAVAHPNCEQVFLTRVYKEVPECTAHFPAIFSASEDALLAAGWRRAEYHQLVDWLMSSELTASSETDALTQSSIRTKIETKFPEGRIRDDKSGIEFEFQLYKRVSA